MLVVCMAFLIEDRLVEYFRNSVSHNLSLPYQCLTVSRFILNLLMSYSNVEYLLRCVMLRRKNRKLARCTG